MLVKEDQDYLLGAKDIEGAAISLHHSLGRHLRNEWGLWQDSELAKHLREKHGQVHPDSMSHFILVHYCRVRMPTLWERLSNT